MEEVPTNVVVVDSAGIAAGIAYDEGDHQTISEADLADVAETPVLSKKPFAEAVSPQQHQQQGPGPLAKSNVSHIGLVHRVLF